MLRIEINNSDEFLIVKETLTRMGIVDHTRKVVWQICHLLHRRGEYFLCHYKELMRDDGWKISIADSEIAQRNGVGRLLEEWGLTKILVDKTTLRFRSIGVIPACDVDNYDLRSSYRIGGRKKEK
jgi:hypothetical protein